MSSVLTATKILRRNRSSTTVLDERPSLTNASLRLDVWLDVACVFKTRAEAQRACKSGKVSINGQRAKPRREVRLGDKVIVAISVHSQRHLIVAALTDHHIPKAQARALYNDVTPAPTAEELDLQELLRRAGPVPGARQGAPGKRERRLRRSLKRN